MPTSAPTTPVEAMKRRRFLLTVWPWRSLAYLGTTPPVVLAAAVPFCILVTPWLVLAIWAGERMYPQPLGTVLALVLLGGVLVVGIGPLLALPLAALERQRLRFVYLGAVSTEHRDPPAGLWGWLRTRYCEPASWKALAYAGVLIVAMPVAYLLGVGFVLLIAVMMASPLMVRGGEPVAMGFTQLTSPGQAIPYAITGLVLLPTVPYVFAIVAGGHSALARALLLGEDPDTLRTRLVEVAQSRARLVDAFEAERRRIERDLHDGAQSRLLNLTLQLGMARLDLPADSPASASVSLAHEQAKELMTELRQLIRGIHPRVLTDRGLPSALDELAEDVAVPLTVTADIDHRLPSHVEVAAYFVVVESLNNVAKHAAATEVSVTAEVLGDTLIVEIVDDGRGGADPERGSGLTGLADRVAVIDGRMLLSSPHGGPTIVRVELPCPT